MEEKLTVLIFRNITYKLKSELTFFTVVIWLFYARALCIYMYICIFLVYVLVAVICFKVANQFCQHAN